MTRPDSEGFQAIRRALLSVTDKTGIIGLARGLVAQGTEILSTGGTAKALADAGIPYTPVEAISGNPEAFGGRMKSISFAIASGILFRRENEHDQKEAKRLGIGAIDLVVCNLYKFQETEAKGAALGELVEAIDVGGPTMIRAAAKNYSSVAVLVAPEQYAGFLHEFAALGGSTRHMRERWAAAAFACSAEYEVAISRRFSREFSAESADWIDLSAGKELRYGENPHQKAYFYRSQFGNSGNGGSITGANIIQGKPLSFNNIRDADAAHRAASDAFVANHQVGVACAIIKHLNPCGLAVADSAEQALALAWAGDPVSAFGGVLCFSGEVSPAAAAWLEDKFVEVIVAPYVAPEALKFFAKKKNLRILLAGPRPQEGKERMVFSVSGGILVQEEDDGLDVEFKSVTARSFDPAWERLAHFGVMAVKHLRSNAIALVHQTDDGFLHLVAAGMGQPNRVDCIRLLVAQRLERKIPAKECLLVSDAFFPFADNVEEAVKLGITRIVQPGGSMRDEETIAAADRLGIAMAFSGRRHFRH